MNDNTNDLKAKIEKLKQEANEARTAGQRQAFEFIKQVLRGESPSHFGYMETECEEMKALLSKHGRTKA